MANAQYDQEKLKVPLPGVPQSYWIATTDDTNYAQLSGEISVDVAIVGGGIAGITTAYLLNEAGVKVAIIEAEKIAKAVSGHTTAKITLLQGLIYKELNSRFGYEAARLYAESNSSSIDKIEEIIKKNNISCDFTHIPMYVYTRFENKINDIKDEVEITNALDIKTSFVNSLINFSQAKAAIRLENQGQFHPRKYLLTLAKKINDKGGYIFENTLVLKLKEGEPCLLSSDKGTIKTKDIIITTNFPFFDRCQFFAKMYPLRSYVYAVRLNKLPPEGMYFSSDDRNYHALREFSQNKEHIYIINGEEHKTGQEKSSIGQYKRLETYIRDNFDVKSIDYRWSTQDYHTVDNLPYIGKTSGACSNGHVYVATGFGGWGMTLGTVSGMLLSDLILGKSNQWATLFDPCRVSLDVATKNLISQNLNVGERFLISRIEELKGIKLSDIGKGEGKTFSNRAVYRDFDGKIHSVSAICTHLGCVVHWNDAEKSWDCPCHGSRFNFDGQVIGAPAINPLKKIK